MRAVSGPRYLLVLKMSLRLRSSEPTPRTVATCGNARLAAVLVLRCAQRISIRLRSAHKNCSIKTVTSLPFQELKSALSTYGEMRGWRWNYHISQIEGRHARGETVGPKHTVRLELTPSDALLLATILNAAADPSWEQQSISRTVPILPDLGEDDTWLTTSEVAKRLGVASKTITGWTTRGAPKTCPFPKGTRVNYRNYWQASVIDQWSIEWKKPSKAPAA